MTSTTNLVYSCVVVFVFIQSHYAWEDDGQPSLHIFHHKCALKKDEGPCKAFLERYYFNIDTGNCENFEYGGCQGNANNFGTFEECEEMCMMDEEKNPCYLPDEPGPCRGLVPRYFFDRKSQRCERFFYGGCFGNANNFRTREECQAKCQQSVIQPDKDGPKPTKQNPNIPILGEGIIRSDKDGPKITKHSQEFPIAANVITQAPVEATHTKAAVDIVTEAPLVQNQVDKLEPVDAVTAAPFNMTHALRQIQEAAELNIPPFCLSPIERGTCDGSERRYTYNPKKKRCQLFRYSGCGGNKNNFVHKRHCMKMCMKGHSNLQLIRIKKKNSHILQPAD